MNLFTCSRSHVFLQFTTTKFIFKFDCLSITEKSPKQKLFEIVKKTFSKKLCNKKS